MTRSLPLRCEGGKIVGRIPAPLPCPRTAAPGMSDRSEATRPSFVMQKRDKRDILTVKEVKIMKIYSTVVSGKEVSKFIRIPDEFKETELKVVVRPVRKKKERFAGLFMNPVRVKRISIPSRDEIHER